MICSTWRGVDLPRLSVIKTGWARSPVARSAASAPGSAPTAKLTSPDRWASSAKKASPAWARPAGWARPAVWAQPAGWAWPAT